MTRLSILVALAALAGAGSYAQAQPLEAPPAIKDAPRVEVKGVEAKGVEPQTEPEAAELLPPKHEVHGETRIEQRRIGTRVREIVVTPAGRSYSYTIENREGRRPLSPQDLASGLSTPRFLKFEF